MTKFEELFDELQEKVEKILSHYSCPNCNDCCKGYDLELEKEEYVKLKELADETNKHIIDNAKDMYGLVYSLPLVPQCSFLDGYKCKIYNDRPSACRRFPFSFIPHQTEGIEIYLVVCPLSVDIIYDYTNYLRSMNQIDVRRMKKFNKSIKNTKTRKDDLRMKIWLNRIDGFIEYLEKKN